MNKLMFKLDNKVENTGENLCNTASGSKAVIAGIRRTSEKWKSLLTGKIWMI